MKQYLYLFYRLGKFKREVQVFYGAEVKEKCREIVMEGSVGMYYIGEHRRLTVNVILW
jgi:hypothetical protein